MSLNYLGPKGYTIYKSNISIIQQQQMKNDLTIKPYTQGAPPGAAVSFPAYRESANKLYVPHYYGVQQLGPPPEIKISEGTNINLHFAGQLRDYQRPVVEKFIDAVRDHAVQRIRKGESIHGWQMVPKRATRKWTDEAAALQALTDAGIDKSKLVLTEMVTPAVAEKLLGKDKKAMVDDLTTKESSGLTLGRAVEFAQ